MNSSNEHELNLIEHLIYYDNETFRQEISNVNGSISVLNLNCGGLNTKFDKPKLFLALCKDINRPISVITLEETHLDSSTDNILFNLSDYTLISDPARINSLGSLATYVNNYFSVKRISIEELNKNSTVYEGMFIEIYLNQNGIKKYIIGNIYIEGHQKL